MTNVNVHVHVELQCDNPAIRHTEKIKFTIVISHYLLTC